MQLIPSVGNSAAPLVNVIELSKPGVSGAEHMVALLSDGTAVAWGRMHEDYSASCGQGSGIGPGIGAGIGHPGNVNLVANGGYSDIEVPQRLRVAHTGSAGAVRNIKGVATSKKSTYLLIADGRVLSFGVNTDGSLGRSTSAASPDCDPKPVTFDGGTPLIKQIAAGNNFAAFLDARGEVWMAGDNTFSQLGRPAGGNTASPATGGGTANRAWKVPNVNQVKAIATAHMTTFALRSDGTVLMWGDEIRKPATAQANHVPMLPAVIPQLTNVMSMWGGQYIMYFLLANGELHAMGRYNGSFPQTVPLIGPWPWQTPTKLNAIAILTGQDRSVGVVGGSGGGLLQATGRPFVWGSNDNSQLGLRTSTSDPPSTLPTQHPMPALPRTDLRFRGYSTSYYHSLAIDYGGRVWAAGNESPTINNMGFLGDGPVATGRTQFVRSLDSTGNAQVENAIQVEACFGTSYALLADGTLKGWGLWPEKISGASSVVHLAKDYSATLAGQIIQVTSAGPTTYALLSDGTVWGRGGNGSQQLGTGVSGSHSNTWVQVSGLTDIIEISASFSVGKAENVHLVALRANGQVMTLGDNLTRQLVGQPGPNQALPQLVSFPGAQGGLIKAISAGNGAFNLALSAFGQVFSWGDDSESQCGQSVHNGQPRPPAYVALPAALAGSVKSIAAGFNCASLLTADGRILAWGRNMSSQAGNSSAVNPQPVPIGISPMLPFKDLRFYQLHQGSDANCAVGISAHNQ